MAGEVIHRIDSVADPSRLPYTVCVLLENLVRRAGTEHVTDADVRALANWPAPAEGAQLAFMPARVIMQDLTGVPAVVDLAALRSAVARRGGDPSRVDPQVPVDLVVDHSVQVDAFGSGAAYERNIEHEYRRNGERYALLRWAQGAFGNFRVVPPGMGIVHQVNLEYLGTVVAVRDGVAMPDTLVGTDSHTTMINALGVLGWGVGGIEAEAVMLGQPIYMTRPRSSASASPAACERRDRDRPGADDDRAAAPARRRRQVHRVLRSRPRRAHRRRPGDDLEHVARVRGDRIDVPGRRRDPALPARHRPHGRPRRPRRALHEASRGSSEPVDGPEPVYTETLDFDLSAVEPSLAGPRRPQDRVSLPKVGQSFADAFGAGRNGGGLGDGSVVISAITSCTNTSNPALMVAAGLWRERRSSAGSRPSPGSRPASRRVRASCRLPPPGRAHGAARAARLQPRRLRLHHVHRELGPAARRRGRCHRRRRPEGGGGPFGEPQLRGSHPPGVRANYLASPPLVVAYALAGTVSADLTTEPLGQGSDGPVYLRDVWPTRRRGEPGARVVVLTRPLH